MKKLPALIIVFLLASCAGEQSSDNRDQLSGKVILDAKTLSYVDLKEEEKESISSLCCSYSETGGWRSNDMRRFAPGNSYFVRLLIDVPTLARKTLLYSCGGSTYVRECSEEKLREKTEEVVAGANPYGPDEPNPYLLYGKYRSSWQFFDGNSQIPSTEKFDGHRITAISRSEDLSRDSVLVGPLPQKPTRMEIQLYNGRDEQGNEIGNPKVSFATK